MPETVLVSKPATLVEEGEFNALTKTVEAQGTRLDRLEHATFGFAREDDNVWVDGVLQNIADVRKQMTKFISIAVKVGVPVGIFTAIGTFGNFLHSAGADQALGAFLKGLFPWL